MSGTRITEISVRGNGEDINREKKIQEVPLYSKPEKVMEMQGYEEM